MSHPAHTTPGRILQFVGLGLFLIGFGLFLVVPFLATFAPDDADWAKALDKIDPSQREALRAAWDGGTASQGLVPFVGALSRAVELANASLPENGRIGDYPAGEFRLALATAAADGPAVRSTGRFAFLTWGLAVLGALLFFVPRLKQELPGVKNHRIFFDPVKSRGAIGIAIGVFLIGFYVLLYFRPEYITEWIRLADPVAQLLKGKPADRWFFYGFLYCLAVLVMGIRFAINYRHSRYQLVRTASVTFFQLGFAFLIPNILEALNRPAMDLKNAWPLNYTFFYDWNLNGLKSGGTFGWVLLVWGIALSFLVIPALAAFFGKRWYCSWVCGCGGLAETLGDPFRQQSNKSLKAWKIERWLIHGVLVFAVVMTGLTLWNYFTGAFGGSYWKWQKWYGFAIGSIFAGVVGTGFYPLMGNRVWCRFGCPLAAVLGMVQKFKSRFRITTNGGQCISCGNCSTYCEMGIDVRWYAQRGQNIIRSSCVGCGICSQVCPRGVLRLETGPLAGRYNEVSLVQIGSGRIDVG
jgi:polyferredoxin